MSVYAKHVKGSPSDVLERAVKYFGPGGLGLTQEGSEPGCLQFSGGGGHVALTTTASDGGTEINLETREWDIQVREFLEKI